MIRGHDCVSMWTCVHLWTLYTIEKEVQGQNKEKEKLCTEPLTDRQQGE